MKLGVIGAGSWGTALALVAARNGADVVLWSRRPEAAEALERDRENAAYLPGAIFPTSLRPTASLAEAVEGSRILVSAVPSHGTRAVFREMRPHLDEESILVNATKGIENESLMRVSEMVAEELGESASQRYVALSGPSFAAEVAKGFPTAVVAASTSERSAQLVQNAFSSSSFRVYTNDDVVGVELGGALKNVIAIATGGVTGLGFGHNGVAAIITRGLAEMTRLAVHMGGRVETLAGLAGLGDLVLTCTGDLSRNRHVGVELGRGRELATILSEMREVAEGVRTTKSAWELGKRTGVELPITNAVYSLLYEGGLARTMAESLMGRPLKKE